MSLLSRFRRTVVPMSSSSSSRKKSNTDDGRLYNYRKPTKSFNEKSVKTRNLPSYTVDSHGDGTTTTGYQYHHRHHRHQQQQQQPQQHQQQYQPNQNLKEKVAIRNSSGNMSKSSPDTRNKSSKSKANNDMLLDSGALSRSNTFTLEEEMNAHNDTYPRAKRKEKPLSNNNTTAANECVERKSK